MQALRKKITDKQVAVLFSRRLFWSFFKKYEEMSGMRQFKIIMKNKHIQF